jgi:hypothetical protein
MKRVVSIAVRAAAPCIVACLLPIAAIAAEPDADSPKADGGLPILGGFENTLPLMIGGGITVGVLMIGFFVLNAGRSEPRRTVDSTGTVQQLPPDVVPGANPLRFFAMPVVFLILLAVALPLGYSIWKSMPEGKDLVTPPPFTPIDMKPGYDMSKLQIAPLPPPPQFDPPKFSMPPVRMPAPPPPIRVPTITPARPPHR